MVTGSLFTAATICRTSALIPEVAPVRISPTATVVDVELPSNLTNS